MEEIKFSDFKVIPDYNSVHKENINDDTYFGENYKKMVSNSRLKWIDPVDGGSPKLYQNPPKLRSTSLSLGSAIHQCVLEADEYILAPKIQKPTAKLGMVMDNIDKLINSKKKFNSFDELIKEAAIKVDYYTATINNKIDFIKSVWFEYLPKIQKVKTDNKKEAIILSDNDWEIANSCIKSLLNNQTVINTLFPTNVFGDRYNDIYCEDAMFIDFIVTYKNHYCAVLPFKMKIDNWNINDDTQTISLNDIKTTGKSVNYFMEPNGSWDHYHYYRQLGVYMSILELYCNKELGLSTKTGWKFEANICAVETIPNYWSKCFKIPDEELHRGIVEFTQLMKRVGYYEMFGYDAEVNFV